MHDLEVEKVYKVGKQNMSRPQSSHRSHQNEMWVPSPSSHLVAVSPLCGLVGMLMRQNLEANHLYTAEDPDRENTGDRFKDWFSRQKQDLLVKASCPIPVDFPVDLWNWELEDEFQKYLPTYVDMSYEADAMDCPEYGYPCQSTLFEKLRP
jgi:hypothetical protein